MDLTLHHALVESSEQLECQPPNFQRESRSSSEKFSEAEDSVCESAFTMPFPFLLFNSQLLNGLDVHVD